MTVLLWQEKCKSASLWRSWLYQALQVRKSSWKNIMSRRPEDEVDLAHIPVADKAEHCRYKEGMQ